MNKYFPIVKTTNPNDLAHPEDFYLVLGGSYYFFGFSIQDAKNHAKNIKYYGGLSKALSNEALLKYSKNEVIKFNNGKKLPRLFLLQY